MTDGSDHPIAETRVRPAASVQLDNELLGELLRDIGPEIVLELADALEQAAGDDLTTLERAIRSGDPHLAMRRLHSLKGASLSAGCQTLGEAAARLETLAREGTLPEPDCVPELRRMLESSLAALTILGREAA